MSQDHQESASRTLHPKDTFLYCAECRDSFLDGCEYHPFLITDGSEFIGSGPSNERDGDPLSVGVFNQSEEIIARSTLLGPLRGDFHHINEHENEEPRSENAVDVLDSNLTELIGFLDPGRDLDHQLHWPYRVVTASDRDEENVARIQFRGTIYLRAIKDIRPYEELLLRNEEDIERSSFDASSTTIKVEINTEEFIESEDELTSAVEPRNNVCLHCNKTFTRASYLGKHIEAVHLKLRNNECPQCGQAFTQSSGLKEHIKVVHDKIRDHVCPHCQKTFVRSKLLNEHIKSVHLQIRDRQCPHCDKAFCTARRLKEHTKAVHEKLRNHQCTHCPKAFSKSNDLRKHILGVHLKTGEHHCPHCSKPFVQYAKMRDHINIVHLKIKDFECPQCDKAFSYSSSLKMHVKTIHEKVKF